MFDEVHRKAVNLSETNIRLPVFRGSGVPYCSFKFLIDCLEYLNASSKWDYNGDFYCDIGTSIHSTIQKWVPRAKPGVILGNWYCKKCDIKIYGKVGPIFCPCCNNQMSYDEFLLNFVKCQSQGHCDGVKLDPNYLSSKFGIKIDKKTKLMSTEDQNKVQDLLYKKDSKIPAYILEYKSTGFWFIRNASKPKTNHRIQASTYASCSKLCLPKYYNINGLDIKGCIVKYFSRENPKLTSDDFKIELEDDSIFNTMCKIVNITYKLINDRKKYVKKVFNNKPCEKWPIIYEECRNKELCSKYSLSDFDKDWKFVIDNIPELKLNAIRLFR